jgi:hypothetical protein
MNLCRRLAALLVVLMLGGCAQVATGQGKASSAPYSHEDKGHPRRWRRRLRWHVASRASRNSSGTPHSATAGSGDPPDLAYPPQIQWAD